MRGVLVVFALLVGLGVAAAGFAVAQEPVGTPGAESELCASPEASPAASPEIDTDASPAAVASEVAEGLEGSLDELVCGTPSAGPTG